MRAYALPGVIIAMAIVGFVTGVRADITLETVQEEYEYGEPCEFILTNDTDHVLDIQVDDVPTIYSVTEDCHVFPCEEYMTGTIWHVQPRSVEQFSWDQIYGDMEFCIEPELVCEGPDYGQVPSGVYRETIAWDVPTAPELSGSASVEFTILDDTAARVATWARIKALFHD